jgi:hypothetical protein
MCVSCSLVTPLFHTDTFLPSDAKEIELLDVRTTLQNTVLAVEERDAIIEQYRLKLRNVERDLTELRQAEGMMFSFLSYHFLPIAT